MAFMAFKLRPSAEWCACELLAGRDALPFGCESHLYSCQSGALSIFSCVFSNASAPLPFNAAIATWGRWPVLAPPCRGAPAQALMQPFHFFVPPQPLRGFA